MNSRSNQASLRAFETNVQAEAAIEQMESTLRRTRPLLEASERLVLRIKAALGAPA